MDQHSSNKAPQFTPEQVNAVLGSQEGKKLLTLLNRDGGALLRKAAEAVRSGDYSGAQALLSPLMQTPEAAELVQRINEKQGSHG